MACDVRRNDENALFKSQEDFIEQYEDACQAELGESFAGCSALERYLVLARLIAHKARKLHVDLKKTSQKRVYYFSLEFLLGPLLDNYLINLGIRDEIDAAVRQMGGSLEDICRQEVDPGLGNGGLGRLAACFLDSMAHEGIAGFGNGMRYHYGLFRQCIEGGRQVEKTDNWLANGFPWETRKDDSAVTVRFNGEVVRHEDEHGSFWFSHEGGDLIRAVPYDVPIVGYGAATINKLRLWSAEPLEEDFDLDAFNEGDYARASKFRSDVEAISTILYPNDSGEHGRLLRLKQEYLFVSAGLQTILRTFVNEHGKNFDKLSDYVAIHTNDTHPAMCGPELMRLLVDEHGVDFECAFEIARKTISFTNHTVLPEAHEKWPITIFRTLLPRLYMVIEEVDRRYRERLSVQGGTWTDILQKTAILWDGQVRMANLSIIFSHSINGVSALHTSILQNEVFKEFYQLVPERFNNKTNGVSHRRFLREANPAYSELISNAIGTDWLNDADKLEGLLAYKDDPSFLEDVAKAKRSEKERLAAYIAEVSGVQLDTNSIFDVQVKRFHAYKRQLLNVFKILHIYNRLLSDPSYQPHPTSFIFSGKAAQSYTFAKEVIRLINSVADVVNNDERTNQIIKVAFVPNFAVSNAQMIYAATEISEQISVAGAEASGTSNMKLMFNGALTLGTLDGSNVEISELVGSENIKIFGLHADEVEALRNSGRYYAWDEYNNDRQDLGRVVDQLSDATLGRLSGNFDEVRDYVMSNNDPDLVLKDYRAYVQAWDELTEFYRDTRAWNRSAVINTAKAGFFSSDRTIREYINEIWHC